MNNSNSIGIIGNGYIGSVEYNLFSENYKVITFDVDKNKSGFWLNNVFYPSIPTHLTINPTENLVRVTEKEINKCKLGIICVPTKVNNDQSPNLEYIENVLSWLKTDLILIKSSIPPGYSKKLEKKYKKKIVFSPEFVGTTKYGSKKSIFYQNADLRDFPFFIFGGDPLLTTKIVDIYQNILGPEKKYIQTTHEIAELVKFTCNCYSSIKLATFYNFSKQIENNSKVDYNKIRELFLNNSNESRWHTSIFKMNPLDKNPKMFDLPYSGMCLPKDIRILNFILKQFNLKNLDEFIY